jgi:hypothetical protein
MHVLPKALLGNNAFSVYPTIQESTYLGNVSEDDDNDHACDDKYDDDSSNDDGDDDCLVVTSQTLKCSTLN